jgi:hypothetical protein
MIYLGSCAIPLTHCGGWSVVDEALAARSYVTRLSAANSAYGDVDVRAMEPPLGQLRR